MWYNIILKRLSFTLVTNPQTQNMKKIAHRLFGQASDSGEGSGGASTPAPEPAPAPATEEAAPPVEQSAEAKPTTDASVPATGE